ncbi:MAG: MBL fold metallo-hydrolase [Solobacterium sp.]|nr:MBL fold metallo-hydrolase [Solobacterium sp.]
MKQTQNGHFYKQEISDGFYMISCPEWDMEKEKSINLWMIEGSEMSVLVDAGMKLGGLKEFLKEITDKPLRVVVSHGHFDHIGNIDDFDEIWMNHEDIPLLSDPVFEKYGAHGYHGTIHDINDGEVWNLGDRLITLIRIRGHTGGSVLVLDHKSSVLISGDTVARDLLYMTEDTIPLNQFFDELLKLDAYEYDAVASAHDRFLLPSYQHHYMMKTIIQGLKNDQSDSVWQMWGQEFFTIHAGSGHSDPKYLSISLPTDKKEQLKDEMIAWAEKNWEKIQ